MEWKPADDPPADPVHQVLVWCEGDQFRLAYWSDDGWDMDYPQVDVLAWMPLPPPPDAM